MAALHKNEIGSDSVVKVVWETSHFSHVGSELNPAVTVEFIYLGNLLGTSS